MSNLNLTKVVTDYIRDQWVNFRRALNEPQAREELLQGARMYFFKAGTTTAVNSYMDSDFAIPHSHPVIANSAGEFPLIWLDRTTPTSIRLYDSRDRPVCSSEDAFAFCYRTG